MRITLFLLFLSAILPSSAQSITSGYLEAENLLYYKMAIENARWRVAYRTSQSTMPPYSSISEFFTSGDTLVNGKEYKKVYKRFLASVNNNFFYPYYPISSPQLTCLLRDDTLSRKVYAISYQSTACQFNQEVLLYDFSYNIGDSVNICLYIGQGDTIESIQSTTVFSRNTNIFRLGNPVFNLYEGIGSNNGLIQNTGDEMSSWQYYLENYCIGPDQNCGIITNYELEPKVDLITIFPNPVSTRLEFVGNNYSYERVEIHDMMGKKMFFENIGFIDLSSYTIDVKNYSPGVYSLKLYSGLIVNNLKFIKL